MPRREVGGRGGSLKIKESRILNAEARMKNSVETQTAKSMDEQAIKSKANCMQGYIMSVLCSYNTVENTTKPA